MGATRVCDYVRNSDARRHNLEKLKLRVGPLLESIA